MLSCFNHVWLFETLWTVAHQAPLSMGFSRQESWGGLLCPPPEELPKLGIEPSTPASPALQADSFYCWTTGGCLLLINYSFSNRTEIHWPIPNDKRTNHLSWSLKVKPLSRIQLFVTLWTVAYQAPPSMEFSRQEYWSGLPFPFPGDLPDPGLEPGFPSLQADALPSELPGKPNCC